MTAWAGDLTSWDVCDLVADALTHAADADRAIRTWAVADHGFAKRCAFSMIARLAVWAKDRPDEDFTAFLPLIRIAATDGRNEVKRAVNWALRQIGKRNRRLHSAAVAEAEAISTLEAPSARWIARDALRELRAPETLGRILA